MTKVDQFESVFRSADKPVFHYRPPSLQSVLIVTDLSESEAYAYGESIKHFLRVLTAAEDPPVWDIVVGGEFDSIASLRSLVDARAPDLVCTYRHLHSDQWREPFTLGDYVEVLTQVCSMPVLVTPHPSGRSAEHAMRDTNTVMAMTDHLANDERIVNTAVRFTEVSGTLYLTHVEDEATFERFIGVIGKIDTLDTDHARETIGARLLKEPLDYIESCRAGLQEHRPTLRIETIVRMGGRLSMCRELVESHEVDLLVINTKDSDQLAMHGLAYPLAVELREIPLLML